MNPDGLYEWSHLLTNSQRYFQHDKMEVYLLANTIQSNLAALASQLLGSASAAVAADSSLRSTIKLDGTYTSVTGNTKIDLPAMIVAMEKGQPMTMAGSFNLEYAYGARQYATSSALVDTQLDLKTFNAQLQGEGDVQIINDSGRLNPNLAADLDANLSLLSLDASADGKGILEGGEIKASTDIGTAYADAEIYLDPHTLILDGGIGAAAIRSECEFVYRIGDFNVKMEFSGMAGGAECSFSGMISENGISFGHSFGVMLGVGYNFSITRAGQKVEPGKKKENKS